MEQKFYKVRLTSGRVIGPMDLERIKLFVLRNKITGLETARAYPSGEWKDINKFPDIAELFYLKLEGKLTPTEPQSASIAEQDRQIAETEKSAVQISNREEEVPAAEAHPHHSISLPVVTEQPKQVPNAADPKEQNPKFDGDVQVQTGTPFMPSAHEDETLVATPDNERTVFYDSNDQQKIVEIQKSSVDLSTEKPSDIEEIVYVNKAVAQEKTQFIAMEQPKKKGGSKKRKLVVAAIFVICALVVLSVNDDKPDGGEENLPFRIEMPTVAEKANPPKAEKTFLAGLPFYNEDTVEGYKKASRFFLKAAALDANNVKTLCLLASAYMNLIDVTNRDENYFTVVTRLIELERAKGVDLPETVIADVELYHILGNPDAAVSRIVEFTKTHTFGAEMFYYLALSFYLKGQYPDALKYLNSIDPKGWFSPRIPYLYGLVFEKTDQVDEAVKAFSDVVRRSPKHIKARVKLAELLSRKDNLPEATKNADFVIAHDEWASRAELSRAHYLRARVLEVAKRDEDAVKDLERANKLTPEDPDILLELYTLRSRLGAKVNEAPGKAKMFYFLAAGEKALMDGQLDLAMSNFLSAREAQYKEPVPLIRIAEVFRRKGDLQSAKINLEKAVKIAPERADFYPKYIHTLIDAYEFEQATRQLEVYKGLNPPVSSVDLLQGDLYTKQERLREAHAYYKRALAGNNADSATYIAYASVMYKGHNFRDAAFYYGLALRFDPFNTEALVGVGKSLADLESLEKGVEYIQNALTHSPHKAALLNGIGELLIRKGDYAGGLKFAENALATDKQFALAHKTRGDAYAAQDKYKEALDAYLTYRNLAPLDPAGYIERYKLYLKKLDLKAGKEEIQKVISIYPRYPGAFYMLGELYREGQNYNSALEAAKKEIELNPTYVPAYVLVGTAFNVAKEHGKALDALNRGLKFDPNFVPALIQAGFANHMLKTYAAAQSLFERALTLDPGNPQIHKRLGSLFHDLGDREKAKQHFRAYLDLYPDAPDRAEMERYLSN